MCPPLGEQTKNFGVDSVDISSDLVDVLAVVVVAHGSWRLRGKRMEEERSAEVVWSALGAEIDEPEETVKAVGATGTVVRAHCCEMLANFQPYVNPRGRM